MPDTDHSQAESSQAEKSNSEKLPLPTGEGCGEGSTFNSATAKQLQELNKINCHAEFISASSHHQVITTSETQNDHLQEHTGGQILKQVQDDNIMRGRIVKQKRAAFTLAEVLITLGIIGVVAALTLPALLTNVQAKIRAEQVRTAKYKFTKATEKMNSLGLIGPYDSTDAFVDELQKHLKISKRCDVNNLRGCWPYETITTLNGEYKVSDAKTGAAFMMKTDADNDYSSNNVGIVTADGVPMILNYNKKCTALDSEKQYAWSTEDNKPVTNATAGCVAAIFEVNGTQKPNKFKQDVIAFNINGLNGECAVGFGANGKCFGAPFTPKPLTRAECEAEKGNLGIRRCGYETDYWAGAVKQCGGVSKMPTMDDLGKLASQLYKGNPSIGAYQTVGSLQWDQDAATSLGFASFDFYLWSGQEYNSEFAYGRDFYSTFSNYDYRIRNASIRQAVCLGD